MSEEKNIKLSEKQKRFCQEYVIDWNATRAAKVAGYSEDSCRQIGSENLSKPYIQAYIEEIQKDLAKLSGVSALRNILELKKLSYSNLSRFKEDWMTEKDFNELTDDEKSCLSEIYYQKRSTDSGSETIVKFKLYDKIKALEVMNKMLGFNLPEKVDHTTNGESLNLSPEDRKRRIAELKSKME